MGIPKNSEKLRQKHTPIMRAYGKYAQNTEEVLQCLTQWVEHNFQITPEQDTPDILHISESTWGK